MIQRSVGITLTLLLAVAAWSQLTFTVTPVYEEHGTIDKDGKHHPTSRTYAQEMEAYDKPSYHPFDPPPGLIFGTDTLVTGHDPPDYTPFRTTEWKVHVLDNGDTLWTNADGDTVAYAMSGSVGLMPMGRNPTAKLFIGCPVCGDTAHEEIEIKAIVDSTSVLGTPIRIVGNVRFRICSTCGIMRRKR